MISHAGSIRSARMRTNSTMVLSARPLPEPARCNSIRVIDLYSQQGTEKTPSMKASDFESINPPFLTPKCNNEKRMNGFMTVDDMV